MSKSLFFIYPDASDWILVSSSDLTTLADIYLIRWINPIPPDVDVVTLVLKEGHAVAPLEPPEDA